MHTCVWACVYVHVRVCVRACVYVYVNMCMGVHTCVYTCAYVCVSVCVDACFMYLSLVAVAALLCFSHRPTLPFPLSRLPSDPGCQGFRQRLLYLHSDERIREHYEMLSR